MELATFAGGCFWCIEAVFDELRGVTSVTSGYAGGRTANPSYEEVCGGKTGHAEVVQIGFDPQVISYRQLLEVFFAVHDPTQLNRQGADVGTQYRSAVFYHDEVQGLAAETFLQELHEAGVDAVTEVSPLSEFFSAEEYHQRYFQRNPTQPYCLASIPPKLEKLRQKFAERGMLKS